MLSIFPSLLTYGLLAPLILRVVVALVLFYSGYRQQNILGWLTVIGTLGLFLGLFTQPVALLLALIISIRPDKNLPSTQRWLLLAILLSLLVTGPGFLAFDLPL